MPVIGQYPQNLFRENRVKDHDCHAYTDTPEKHPFDHPY